MLVGDAAFSIALTVGLEIAEIANMTVRVVWGSVPFAEGVDYVSSVSGPPLEDESIFQSRRHTVGACRCAAIGVVTELVDVHATLSIGVVAGNVVGDGGGGGFVRLFEGHLARDLGVSSEDGDCVQCQHGIFVSRHLWQLGEAGVT